MPRSLSRPVGRLTTVVHPFIVEYPHCAAVVRKWSPEHMMVPPHKALPGVPMVESAPLSASVYLERHDGRAAELRDISRADMVARMLGNFHSEMTPSLSRSGQSAGYCRDGSARPHFRREGARLGAGTERRSDVPVAGPA